MLGSRGDHLLSSLARCRLDGPINELEVGKRLAARPRCIPLCDQAFVFRAEAAHIYNQLCGNAHSLVQELRREICAVRPDDRV